MSATVKKTGPAKKAPPTMDARELGSPEDCIKTKHGVIRIQLSDSEVMTVVCGLEEGWLKLKGGRTVFVSAVFRRDSNGVWDIDPRFASVRLVEKGFVNFEKEVPTAARDAALKIVKEGVLKRLAERPDLLVAADIASLQQILRIFETRRDRLQYELAHCQKQIADTRKLLSDRLRSAKRVAAQTERSKQRRSPMAAGRKAA